MIIKDFHDNTTDNLSHLCNAVGTSDIQEQVDEFDYEKLKDFARGEHFVEIMPVSGVDVYGVVVAEGTKDAYDPYGANGEATKEVVVATLNACEEGLHWELPLLWLQAEIERELETLSHSACVNAPDGYDIQHCKYQEKNCICQCKRDS